MNIKDGLQQLAENPKVASGAAAMTTGTGIGTFLDWIPNDIGKLATLVGIILSVVLIRVHLTNLKKAQLELQIMRDKEEERKEETRRRIERGEPVRREADRR